MEENLSIKHGVVPPKAIVFFGPPGTGKTHFVKAIAGILSWRYIEIFPSMLMAEGVEKIGANLREVMEEARHLDKVVLFIDEFEEIAGSRDTADRIDKSVTNEFLKQIPLLKNQENKILRPVAFRLGINILFGFDDFPGKFQDRLQKLQTGEKPPVHVAA